MTGWEVEDLTGTLDKAFNGKPKEIEKMIKANPFARANKDYTTLLVMRKFGVSLWKGKRSVFNGAPENEKFQWGITIVSTDANSSSEMTVYIPNKYQYTGIDIKGDEVTITAEGMVKKTNITELFRKLDDFMNECDEKKLEAAFDAINNEQYQAAPKPEVENTVIESKVLGTLTYDEKYEWYRAEAGTGKWPFNLSIHLVESKKLKKLVAFAEDRMKNKFYEKALADMEPQMLELKNEDWLEEDEKPMSAASFRKNISIQSIEFYDDQSTVIYCDDNDIFGGHLIEISLDKKGKMTQATLVG